MDEYNDSDYQQLQEQLHWAAMDQFEEDRDDS